MSDNRTFVEQWRSSANGNENFGFHSAVNDVRGEGKVVHLYLAGKPNKIADDGGQALVVSQDIHICGTCNKQFEDVVDFLHHKRQHSLGNNLFKCDLCKILLPSQQSLQEHYDIIHQLSLNLSSVLPLDNVTHSNEANGIHDNRSSAESTRPSLLFQSFSLEFLKENEPKPSSSCKRKSRLQVKPMLESTVMEEEEEVVLEQSNLFEKVFPELQDAREFDSFVTPDHVESNGIDADFIRVVASGEEESGTEETSTCLKLKNAHLEQPDFSFLYVTEHCKPSRFSHARCWLKCLHCDYRTRKHTLLTSHMADLHKGLQKQHQNNSTLIKDYPVEAGQKVMQMSAYEAMLGTNSLNRRLKHQRRLEKQDISGAYPCSICGKIFRRFRYLRKHQETHQTEKMFVCDDCGKSYKSRTYLRVHRRMHVQKKEFSCNQCNFVSNINAAIHAHRQIHNSGSVLCDICGYAYTDRSTLGKHKRVHDLNRPFACNFSGCKWRFKTEVMCRAHIRAHTTQGKFRCADCGYVFRHKHHLQRHELHMHGTKTDASLPFALPFSPRGLKGYSLEEESDQFVSIRNLGLSQALTSDSLNGVNSAHLVAVHDSSELQMTFNPNDLSLINVEYSLLDADGLNPKDEDEKHLLISELEVFN